MNEKSPLIIWVYLTKDEIKTIRKNKVVQRKVGKLADTLPIKIYLSLKEAKKQC